MCSSWWYVKNINLWLFELLLLIFFIIIFSVVTSLRFYSSPNYGSIWLKVWCFDVGPCLWYSWMIQLRNIFPSYYVIVNDVGHMTHKFNYGSLCSTLVFNVINVWVMLSYYCWTVLCFNKLTCNMVMVIVFRALHLFSLSSASGVLTLSYRPLHLID